jgi:hypothetical protein
VAKFDSIPDRPEHSGPTLRGLSPLGLVVIVVIIATGILVFRTGSPSGPAGSASASVTSGASTPTAAASTASAATTPSAAATPTASVSAPAASPAAATRLTQIDLPGPAYDLTFDRARDSLWYAVMGSGSRAALYQYAIATGQTSSWTLPATTHNGFLERVAVAPDGSVWVTEEYSVVRVDPASGHVTTHTFPLADADAIPGALDTNPSPGTWPTAIAFDSQRLALVARHNVRSLTRLDSSIRVVGRVQLPAAIVGPSDLVDSNGVIYAAPYMGSGPAVLLSENGVSIGSTAEDVGRLGLYGTSVAAIGSTGLTRIAPDATMTQWQAGLYGGPNDRLALVEGGAALYLDGQGLIEWISPSGAVEGRMSFASVPIQVTNPLGQPVTALSRDQVGAIAADGTGSVWYVDTTLNKLVHVTW